MPSPLNRCASGLKPPVAHASNSTNSCLLLMNREGALPGYPWKRSLSVYVLYVEFRQQCESYFMRVIIASYALRAVFSVSSSGRQPPVRVLPSSLKLPVYVAPKPECLTVLS